MDPQFKTTDDCGVVRKYSDEPVFVVRGEESNMKLTYREDTYMLDKLFQLKNTEPQDISHVGDIFRDKVAVVFGGSYGIGKNIVEMLEQSGARVFSYSRSENHIDVGQREDVARALTEAHEQAGRIDYVICTAGVLNKEPLTTMDYATIQAAVQTNYLGTVNVALEAHPYLKQTEGKLIFFTSSSYTRGRAFYSIYSSTKAAIVNFVQAVAQEWDGDGIMHRRDQLFPLSTITFVGKTFSAPHDTDAYLRDLYRDYMAIPPKEKQKVHAVFILPELMKE